MVKIQNRKKFVVCQTHKFVMSTWTKLLIKITVQYQNSSCVSNKQRKSPLLKGDFTDKLFHRW